jgi:hypothetical protein
VIIDNHAESRRSPLTSSNGPSLDGGGSTEQRTGDERYKIVLDEAIRSLNHQQTVIDSMRSRVTVIVAAAALVSSFIGAPAFQLNDHVTWPTRLGLLALLSVLICAAVICVPRKWVFRSSANMLVQAIDAGFSLDEFRKRYSLDLEKWVDENEKKIRGMHWWFVGALGSLLAELLFWALQFRGWW